jgi:two-component system, chemotaxis family, protein-glutamate methylesterase/glutaminase
MMKWDASQNGKWITRSTVGLSRQPMVLINNCTLAASKSGVVLGFIVFETADVNAKIISKIQERVLSPEVAGAQFEIFCPPSLVATIKELSIKSPLESILKFVATPFLEVTLSAAAVTIRRKLRVVVVDDSSVTLLLLGHVFKSSGWVDVVGSISDSTVAVQKIAELKPDVVTLDIQMPNKDGIQVLKEILAVRYLPVLMITSIRKDEGASVMDALNAGAFDYIQKPTSENRVAEAAEMLTKVLGAVTSTGVPHRSKEPTRRLAPANHMTSIDKRLVWAIGASTGGTQALTRVLTHLPAKIPPTLIVQHIPPIFSKSFAEALNRDCPFTVKEAENGESLHENFVYIAPGGAQMTIKKAGEGYVIVVTDDEPVNRFKPSVDYLFSRLAKMTELTFVAGILTGMGRDGAEGLLAMRNAGAKTFAQDEASSTVYGMPKAAFEVGAVDKVCDIDAVSEFLLQASQAISAQAAKLRRPA